MGKGARSIRAAMERNDAGDSLHLELWELEEREVDRRGLTSYPCPCRNCMGGRSISRPTIRKHLCMNGRDPQFTKPILVCPKHYMHVACIFELFFSTFSQSRVASPSTLHCCAHVGSTTTSLPRSSSVGFA
jgi:hypothetical protein